MLWWWFCPIAIITFIMFYPYIYFHANALRRPTSTEINMSALRSSETSSMRDEFVKCAFNVFPCANKSWPYFQKTNIFKILKFIEEEKNLQFFLCFTFLLKLDYDLLKRNTLNVKSKQTMFIILSVHFCFRGQRESLSIGSHCNVTCSCHPREK